MGCEEGLLFSSWERGDSLLTLPSALGWFMGTNPNSLQHWKKSSELVPKGSEGGLAEFLKGKKKAV